MNNGIINPSNLYSVVANAMFLKTVAVTHVVLHFSTLCGMMVRNSHSFYAKFVSQDSILMPKADLTEHMCLNVLTAAILSYIRKTAGTSLFISVLTRNVHTTCTT